MQQLGIEPPPREDIGFWNAWLKWFRLLRDAVPKVQTFQITINPAAVGASATSEQTFTVVGLTTNDIVFTNKPSHNSGLGIVNCRVSAADTLAITFMNVSGGSIDPGSESYLLVAIRL